LRDNDKEKMAPMDNIEIKASWPGFKKSSFVTSWSNAGRLG